MITIPSKENSDFNVCGYTPQTLILQEQRIRQELEAFIRSSQPMFSKVIVYNQTKTAQVRCSVNNGCMHITIHDPEEDYQFKLRNTHDDKKEKENNPPSQSTETIAGDHSGNDQRRTE